MAPRGEDIGADQSRLDLTPDDQLRSRTVVGKLEEVANILFRPPSYRQKRRRESETNSFSAEHSKDQIEKLIEIEERERIRALKKEMEEAQEYNRFLIKKHGAEGAHNLGEKGLIDMSKLVDHADAEKVFEMQGKDMLFESGNDKMHPAVTLMDLHDLSEEEEPVDQDSWEEASAVAANNIEEDSICLEDDTLKRKLSSKIIINTMAPKSQPNLQPWKYTAGSEVDYNRTRVYLPN